MEYIIFYHYFFVLRSSRNNILSYIIYNNQFLCKTQIYMINDDINHFNIETINNDKGYSL